MQILSTKKNNQTEEDKQYFKKLIKQSIAGVSDLEFSNLTSQQKLLDLKSIDAYEVAFYVNFQPTYIKIWVKTICKQLALFCNDIEKLMQIVRIISKTAITVTSLRCMERIFNSEELMQALNTNIINQHWVSPTEQAAQQGTMWSMVAGYWNAKTDSKREMLIHRCTEMVQIWADLTMMYQGDFMPLHMFYRDLRQRHVPFPSQRDRKYFDDLRQMQMNVPLFDDVIIFQLDENPLISRVDRKQWMLHVKHDENWKVFGACKILWATCQQYETSKKELSIQSKKEDTDSIGLQLRCENLVTRIQYLFNFIMNYRSRYAHNIKNKKNKFLLEEHQASYQQLCDKLKEAKAIMDKQGVSPQVRKHERQSMRYNNTYEERQLEIEDDLSLEQSGLNKTPTVINLGKLGGSASDKDAKQYQQMSDSKPQIKNYKFSQKMVAHNKKLDENDFDMWIEKIANGEK